MMLDHGVGQDMRHVAQLPGTHVVLEAREGRLRRQRGAGKGVAVEEKLVDRIVGPRAPRRCSGVAAGDTKDALAEQLEALVLDFAGLPKIDEAARQALGQLELGIEPLSKIAPPSVLVSGMSNAATTGLLFGSNPNATCVIHAVAIEPPRLRASNRPDTASIAPASLAQMP